MKELLTIQNNGTTQKFFIMGNHGQLKDSKYYDTMKEATIEMFRLCKQNKKYSNIYDMPDREYKELTT